MARAVLEGFALLGFTLAVGFYVALFVGLPLMVLVGRRRPS